MPIETSRAGGPAIRAVDPWRPSNPRQGERQQLLSDHGRARLAKIAVVVRFGKGDHIYREGEPAEAVFNVISGVVTAYRALADGDHVTSFLHPGDLFGLSEEGRYTNGTKAATAVVAYKMPVSAVRRLLTTDAELDVGVIVKLCENLRESQRHALLLTRKRAATRLVMFLDLQQNLQLSRGESTSEIRLPMDRSSIAAYLGITLAALGRAFRTLSSKKIIAAPNRRHVKILNKEAFDKLADMASVEDDTKNTHAPLQERRMVASKKARPGLGC